MKGKGSKTLIKHAQHPKSGVMAAKKSVPRQSPRKPSENYPYRGVPKDGRSKTKGSV